MRPFVMLAALLAVVGSPAAAALEPIIDMHLHARAALYAGNDPPPMCTPFEVMPRSEGSRGVREGLTFARPPCERPVLPARTDEQVLRETVSLMERFNIYGVVSGEPERISQWVAAAPERFMPAVDYRVPGAPGAGNVGDRALDELRALHAQGRLVVIGEIMAQYQGVPFDDARLEPLWALAEELDVPVAVHMGPGEPGQPYARGGYRAALGDPLQLEPVLVRHPKLRVSVMHAGYPMAERMRALMFSYPQVYAEIGAIVYNEPKPAFHAFLRSLVEAGYGDRIMFGSDQMIWPGVIEAAIATIEDAPYLSAAQKRDIFYNNAARFLRLDPAQMAAHRAK
jgi:predicted TIM-barrel fold metal-dependent hydrolase